MVALDCMVVAEEGDLVYPWHHLEKESRGRHDGGLGDRVFKFG